MYDVRHWLEIRIEMFFAFPIEGSFVRYKDTSGLSLPSLL